MKNKIDRMKNRAKGLSKRSLALMLSILVLITAVGAGAVITAIAATTSQSVQNEQERIEATSNLYDTEEKMLGTADDDADAITLSQKGDVDLAATGYDYCTLYYKLKDAADFTSASMTMGSGNNSASVEVNLTTTGQYNFYFKANSDYFGGTGEYTVGQSNFDAHKQDNASNATMTLSGVSTSGTYKFEIKSFNTSGGNKISVTQTSSSSYAINYNSTTNGSLSPKPAAANANSNVSITATPSTGYEVDTFTVKGTSDDVAVSTTKSGNTFTFTMPAKNVTVSATFKIASYAITKSASNCTITADTSAAYNSDVRFKVTPDTDYAIKSVTVKKGTTNVATTDLGGGKYSFKMPAGAVTITATCATTKATTTVYFKSSTAYVYHPILVVNGVETDMEKDADLNNADKGYTPYSDTGSLKFAWYKLDLENVDTTKPVQLTVKCQDTYMEATGTFELSENGSIYLACDDLMSGKTLVDVTDDDNRDFYDTPINMIAD